MFRYLAVTTAMLLMISCKEKGPFISMLPPPVDTAYSAPLESPQERVVLVEEFTGVTCPQCPAGHDALKGILTQNPGKVAIIGIQPIGNAQSRPFKKDTIETKRDNRTQAGTDIGSTIYGGVAALPQAGINRIADGGNVSNLFLRTDWAYQVDNQKKIAPKANITISTLYENDNRKLAVTVRVAYTQTVFEKQKLTIAITEDRIVDVQELGEAPGYKKDYVHEHVLREVRSVSPTGDPILTTLSPIPAGQVYERTFVMDVADYYNPDNCHVVVFIANDTQSNQEVLQAAEKSFR